MATACYSFPLLLQRGGAMFVGLQNPSFPGWLQKVYFFPSPTISESLGSTVDKYPQFSQVTEITSNNEGAKGKMFSLIILKWTEEFGNRGVVWELDAIYHCKHTRA